MFLTKPPKLFRTTPVADTTATPTATEPTPQPTPQAWSPAPIPQPAAAPAPAQPVVETSPAPNPDPITEPATPETSAPIATETAPETPVEQASQPIPQDTPAEADLPTPAEPTPQPIPHNINTDTEVARYARPKEAVATTEPTETIPGVSVTTSVQTSTQSMPDIDQPTDIGNREKRIVRARSVSSIPFADLWYTPEKIAYIRDESTKFALIPFEADDLKDFYKALEQGYTGASSYALKFAGESYRIERIVTITGVQYNCRKMPTKTPDIYTLGLPEPIVDYLVGLSQEAGLILFGGPTGMGKTTTASALMRKYLERDGGFMYTIEDPPEMPLDGLYHAANGALGLCKQCPVENERWSDGIKSALRSRPRYILVGEIRTPETASQVLRAATSGHLVLSTIHASSVEDSLNSILKYAAGAGLAESLVADLLARGILAVVHQKLEGTEKLRPVLHTAFANPNPLAADQMRMSIRDGKINLGTLMEAQTSKLFQGKPLFREF